MVRIRNGMNQKRPIQKWYESEAIQSEVYLYRENSNMVCEKTSLVRNRLVTSDLILNEFLKLKIAKK
uniref:Uncharacterized protein n=2 Tax=Caenorhabditis japonica TaxID=281687 RepID=A0A8R1IW18_CAEJA